MKCLCVSAAVSFKQILFQCWITTGPESRRAAYLHGGRGGSRGRWRAVVQGHIGDGQQLLLPATQWHHHHHYTLLKCQIYSH